MPVHSLIIVNFSGNVIYSKYFQDGELEDGTSRLFFEQKLFKQTAPDWNRVINDGTGKKSTVSFGDLRIVYQTIGDMIFFLTGYDETDEMICKFHIKT
jgi:hypothetical protein